MFITKKHLSRRTLLRGAGAAIALPLLDSMIPARTALAQTAATPKSRLGCIYIPHGATMDKWTPAAEGTKFEFSEILRAARAVPRPALHRERARAQAGRAVDRRGHGRRRESRARGRGVLERRASRQRRPRVRRPHGRPARGGRHRSGHAAAVRRALDRGAGLELRRGLHVRVSQHARVEIGDAAAADGEQSAGGVRAPVRRRQHRRAAPSAPRSGEEPARLRDRPSRIARQGLAGRGPQPHERLPRRGPRGRAPRDQRRPAPVVRHRAARSADRRARHVRGSI